MTSCAQARGRSGLRTDGGEQQLQDEGEQADSEDPEAETDAEQQQETEDQQEGEQAEGEQEEEAEGEQEDEAEGEQEDEGEQGDEAEGEQEDDGEDEAGGGVSVVHLDLEGLFLDVLGLEVDLNEVVLDVSASPGEGKLLGNLLGGISGLPGSVIGDLFGGGDGDDGGGGFLSGIFSRIVGWLRDQVRQAIDELNVRETLGDVTEEFVQELADNLESNSDSEG